MPRYIDADAAKIDAEERGGTLWLTDGDVKEVKRFLDDQPTADVAPVVHGHWVAGRGLCYPTCSICNNYSPAGEDWTFCPWCGAKMDEGVKNDAVH